MHHVSTIYNKTIKALKTDFTVARRTGERYSNNQERPKSGVSLRSLSFQIKLLKPAITNRLAIWVEVLCMNANRCYVTYYDLLFMNFTTDEKIEISIQGEIIYLVKMVS